MDLGNNSNSLLHFSFLFTQGPSWSGSCLLFFPHIPDSLRKCKFLNLPISFCLLFLSHYIKFPHLRIWFLISWMWISPWTSSSVFASPLSLPRLMLCKHTQAILIDLISANTVSYGMGHTVLYFYAGFPNRLWHTWLLKWYIYIIGTPP